jgi:hypothetical protein
VRIDVATNAGPDGSVTCDIDVDGSKAAVTFADGEISLSVGVPGGAITFTVPESLAAGNSPA